MKKLLLVLTLLAFGQPLLAADHYFGTLERKGNQLLLVRCDLAKSRFYLTEVPGKPPALTTLQATRLDGRPVYVELFARYEQRQQLDFLQVELVKKIEPGKSCHLLD